MAASNAANAFFLIGTDAIGRVKRVPGERGDASSFQGASWTWSTTAIGATADLVNSILECRFTHARCLIPDSLLPAPNLSETSLLVPSPCTRRIHSIVGSQDGFHLKSRKWRLFAV